MKDLSSAWTETSCEAIFINISIELCCWNTGIWCQILIFLLPLDSLQTLLFCCLQWVLWHRCSIC